MNKHYGQLAIFYHVVDFRSFTRAAKHLDCSKSHISKQLSDLERAVGTPLLHRNIRTMQLTVAGEALLEHARLIVHEFQNATNTIAGLQNKVEGILRITSPSAYADCILAPNLDRFLSQYPDLSLEMNFTGELVNLVEQKIDVAIRLTHEPPVDRVAKRIGEYQMIVCASPAYLDKHAVPKNPQQLQEHPCLVYSTEKNSSKWPFIVEQTLLSIAVKPLIAANSSQVLLNAALNGKGIARLPSYVVDRSIKENRLHPLLREYYPPPVPIYAIYAAGRSVPPKIRAFIEFIYQLEVRP